MDLSFLGNHVGELISAVAALTAALSSVNNRKKITQVRLSLNGRLSELIAAERKVAEEQIAQSEARGYAKGLAEGVARADNVAASTAENIKQIVDLAKK